MESASLFAYADEEPDAQRGEFTSQGHLNEAVVGFGYKLLPSLSSISISPFILLFYLCPCLRS